MRRPAELPSPADDVFSAENYDPLIMRMAPGLTNVIVGGTLVAFAVIAGFRIALVDGDAVKTWISMICVALLLVLQFAFFLSPAVKSPGPPAYLLLIGQAILVFGPMIAFRDTWISLPGFLAGDVLLATTVPISPGLFVAVVAAMGIAENEVRGGVSAITFSVVSTATTGLIVYGITRLAWIVRDVSAARAQITTTAIGEQRLRFEHDVHELLGQRLALIAAKSEYAKQRVVRNVKSVRDELVEILDIAHATIADIRAFARDCRGLSLVKECEKARSMLGAADIEVDLTLNDGELPGEVGDVLSSLVRESVTNVLRHSDAQRCAITVNSTAQAVTLEVDNDGVADAGGEATGPAGRTGGGLAKLGHRVEELGGELVAEPQGDGQFRLYATVPLDQVPVDDGEQARNRTTRMAPRLADAILVGVVVGFGTMAAVNVMVEGGTVFVAACGLAYLAGVVFIQLAYFSRPTTTFTAPTVYLALLAQAALTYLPLAQIGNPWVPVIGILAGSVLLSVRPGISVPLFILISLSGGVAEAATSMPWAKAVHADSLVTIAYSVIATVITGLVVFGLSRLSRLTCELESIGGDVAHSAVVYERLRFARDLHDLLGLGLSTITLRCETAYRLVDKQPEKAGAELSEIIRMTRNALADARSAATGCRELSIDQECRSAESVLTAIDIDVRIDRAGPECTGPTASVLATVLREGVTNVLRHSKAEWCRISIRTEGNTAVLEILNDGVRPAPVSTGPGAPNGAGMRNLSHRVRALGGELEAGPDDEDIFRLRAAIPQPSAPARAGTLNS